ncbi:hypothetical protein HFN54_35780 [Rhizobium leguminosarum]|nr:hypothetical protein [Rhizobium leguminosarum]
MDDAWLPPAKSSFPANMSAPADAVGVNGIAFGSRNHQWRFFVSAFLPSLVRDQILSMNYVITDS